MPISDKFKQEETKPSDIEALLRLLESDNTDLITEINYPYEIAALVILSPILKDFDNESGKILEKTINQFKKEMIPFKRARVKEILEGLKHIKSGEIMNANDIINNNNQKRRAF